MTVAIDVKPGLFGPPLVLGNVRFGDLIAACNFLEYLRVKIEMPELKLCFRPESLFPSDHVFKFVDFLCNHTDYVTKKPDQLIQLQVLPGTDPTYPTMYNIWNIRQDVTVARQNVLNIPDAVEILNPHTHLNKVVICPLMDAPYNAYRNWPLELVQHLVNDRSEYPYDEHIIISKAPIDGLDIKKFTYSHDFETNLQHVMTCKSFSGGETGFTKFASVLNPGPKFLNYYYSKETYGTTFPFSWKKKGTTIFYDRDDYQYPGKR